MVETNNTFTFMMKSNLLLVARFENPFYRLANTWCGLFSEATPDLISAGFITFTVVPNNGSYTGNIWLDGTQYKLSYPDAQFDLNGHSHLMVPRQGKSDLTIDMDMDVVTYSGTITGTVVASPQPNARLVPSQIQPRDVTSGWNANLLVHRAWTNVGDAEFRRYTMAFPPVSGPTPSPTGWGVGTTTNAASGSVMFLGFAADGAQINTPTTFVSENLEYPFYGELYGSTAKGYQGSMWGWLTFSKDQPGVTGTVYWWRPAGVAASSSYSAYPGGFSNIFQVIGSPYTNFPSGTADFGWTGPAIASFTDGPTQILQATASVDTADKVTFTRPNTNMVALRVTRMNGLVNGTLLQPFVANRKDPPYRGVILQNSQTALGHYYPHTNAGGFMFQPQ